MPSNKRKREARQSAALNNVKYTEALRSTARPAPTRRNNATPPSTGLRIRNCGLHRGAGNAETMLHELVLLDDEVPVIAEAGSSGWAHGAGMIMTVTPLAGAHRGQALRVCWRCVDNSVHARTPVSGAPPGQFHSSVLRTIALATRWRDEVNQTQPEVLTIPSPEADALLKALVEGPMPPAEAALREFLTSLPDDDVMKLQTLMYVGRPGGGDSFSAMHRHLLGVTPDKEDAVRTMVSKTPLSRYLIDGLEKALETGVDLEAPSPAWLQE